MSDELQAFALKTALTEIKNACPDVSNTFIFAVNGKLLATDDTTNEETAKRATKALNALSKEAKTIGGFESAVFYSASNRMNVFRVNDYYLTIVSSEESSRKNSADLARILIPTVLRLTEKICKSAQQEAHTTWESDASEETSPYVEELGADLSEEDITATERKTSDEQPEHEAKPETLFPDPPVTQFMVENMGGLLASPDVVRIDNAVMQQWKDLYGERKISEVDIETLNGQTIRCKFKPIKDSKREGKGIIQLPHKIQQLLQTSKGELVVVKPAIR
jgi:hypothetical protein